MAQKVQPQGLKSDGTLGTFRISDNNNLLVDFTPTSDDGLATAANQTSGEQKTQIVDSNGDPVDPVTALKILDKDGANELVIDSDGKITITNASFGISSITAGETHVGAVGGNSDIISPTVTVDTSAYSANDVIGGKLTLTNAMRVNGGTGLLQSLMLIDTSGTQKPALEIIIFNADPTASTITDQATISVHTDDVAKVIRKIDVAASDWTLIGGKYYADISPGTRLLKSASGSKNLYAAIVAVGTPTFAASTNFKVNFGILQD